MQAVPPPPPPPPPPARRRWRLAVAVLLLVVAAVGMVALVRARIAAAPPDFHGTAYVPPDAAPAFTLTDHTGAERSLADFRGRVVLLFFGYTHCPDVCPLTLSRLTEALAASGAGPEEAQVLLVSVDPARDTPPFLARYVERFGSLVTGLTADGQVLRTVYADYGIHASASHGGGMPAHTSAVIGIDREGRRRVVLRADAPREELHADIERLLEL
jgi:protein SCO1